MDGFLATLSQSNLDMEIAMKISLDKWKQGTPKQRCEEKALLARKELERFYNPRKGRKRRITAVVLLD
jgi:hypothetical protein